MSERNSASDKKQFGSSAGLKVGAEALEIKGFWRTYKWLILRRIVQFSLLTLFIFNPWLWLEVGDPVTDQPVAQDVAKPDSGIRRKSPLPEDNITAPALAPQRSADKVFAPRFGADPMFAADPLFAKDIAPTESTVNKPKSSSIKDQPIHGRKILEGNLASSIVLGTIPLSDPFIVAQSLSAGTSVYKDALIGAGLILAFYLIFGGRLFCSWVCPMNIVTDAAGWLRRRLGLKGGKAPAPSTRYWLLLFVLILAAITGVLAWEWVNPVSMLQRGLIFGFGLAWGIVAGVFFYDLLIAGRGWCGHLCPHGAFYGVLNRTALLRVKAEKASECNDCMDCFAVCPEPQVIRPALKKVGQDHPVILDGSCTTCGRCIDVCSKDVFRISTRFNRSES